MNLLSRISRIEAAEPPMRMLEIIASDEDDLREQVILSGVGPGPVRVTGIVAGQPIDEMHDPLSHEECLELIR